MLTKEDFIAKTLEQIRWKKAHESVEKELSDHIDDQKSAFLNQNMTEEQAIEKAVLEMGDPIEVGTLLDSSYRPRTDKGIIIAGAFMMLIGIIISGLLNNSFYTQPTYLIGFIIAVPIAFIVPFFLDISTIYKNIWWAVGIYIIFLLWAAIFASQTRLLVRLVTYSAFVMPPLCTILMCRMRGRGYIGFLIACFTTTVMAVLLFSMSGGVAFSLLSYAVCIMMAFYAIFKGWFGSKVRPLVFMGLTVVLMTGYVLSTPINFYIMSRLKRMFFPQTDPLGYGWITLQARDFLSRSVFFGRGAGESVYNSLPSYHTDYALTSLVHRFGFIAAIVLGIVMVIFLCMVLKIARKQISQLAKSVSYTIFLVFLVNTSIYFLINMGIIGSISTCPTFLFGGKAAMIVNAFLLGILASTNRNGSIISDNTAVKSAFKIERTENKLIITFGEE